MKYTHDYLTRQFWNGEKGSEKLEMNETGYEEALRRALKDFTPRTEKKKADGTEKLDVDKMLAKLKDEKFEDGKNFLDRFVDFFDGEKCENAKKFDKWHDGMCEKCLKVFRDYYDSLAYGKAQKIVNMTFKGIYCLNGAEKKEEYFRYCHMPLDSLTLEWFRRNVKIDGKQVVKKNVAPWSKLSNDKKSRRRKVYI